jgi:raffinose/stachyose/melibiose transport system permease protein
MSLLWSRGAAGATGTGAGAALAATGGGRRRGARSAGGGAGATGPRALHRLAAHTVAVLIALALLVPLVYVVLGGFRTTGQLADDPAGLPDPWVTDNYRDIATSSSFWRQVGNSALIASLTTVLVVVTGAHAAFALSRIQFRGREGLFTLFTMGLLFPVAVAVLPLFVLLRRLDLLDSALGVALPQAAFGLPVTIIILRPFMRAIPGELEDAAAIDGCSRLGFFWRVLLPLCRPALATVSIYTFIQSWNAFLLPMLVLNDEDVWTLPLGVFDYSSRYTQDTAPILAFTALSMVPALAVFAFAERRIVQGLKGALKG